MSYDGTITALAPDFRWKFDGSTAEDGGHSTSTNGTPYSYATSLIPNESTWQAMDFDGGDDHLRPANDPLINTGNGYTWTKRSVSFWMNADDVTSQRCIWEEGGGTNWMTIYFLGGELYANIGEGNSSRGHATANVSAGTTYHVCVVFDLSLGSNGIKIYINGSLEGQANQTAGTDLDAHGGDNRIGHGNSRDHTNANSPYVFYDGRLQDFCYWNEVALTAQDVDDIYQAGAGSEYNPDLSGRNTEFSSLYVSREGKIGIGTDATNEADIHVVGGISIGGADLQSNPDMGTLEISTGGRFLGMTGVGGTTISGAVSDADITLTDAQSRAPFLNLAFTGWTQTRKIIYPSDIEEHRVVYIRNATNQSVEVAVSGVGGASFGGVEIMSTDPYEDYLATLNPTHRWLLDGSVGDSEGGATETVTGSLTYTSSLKSGSFADDRQSAIFDGNSYIGVGDTATINTGIGYTFEQRTGTLWMRTGSDVTTRQGIWAQGDDSTWWSLYIDGGNLYLDYGTFIGAGGGGQIPPGFGGLAAMDDSDIFSTLTSSKVYANTTINANQTYFVSFAADSFINSTIQYDTVYLYLDGVVVSTANTGSSNDVQGLPSHTPIYIGFSTTASHNNTSGNFYPFDGQIEDVCYWDNVLLTDTQISTLYTHSQYIKETPNRDSETRNHNFGSIEIPSGKFSATMLTSVGAVSINNVDTSTTASSVYNLSGISTMEFGAGATVSHEVIKAISGTSNMLFGGMADTTFSDMNTPNYDFEGAYPFDDNEGGTFTIQSTTVKHGTYSLRSNHGGSYRSAVDTGKTMYGSDDVWIKGWIRAENLNHAFRGIGFCFVNNTSGPLEPGYYAILDMRGPLLSIRRDFNHGLNTEGATNASVVDDTWYWLEFNWHNSTLTAKMYDEPSGTELLSVTRTDSTYSWGHPGVAAYSNGFYDDIHLEGLGDQQVDFDFTSFANVTRSGSVNSTDWLSASNAASLDGTVAAYSEFGFFGDGYSDYLASTDISGSIPGGSTINGIEVTIHRRASSASGTCSDDAVYLTKDGTSPAGSNKSAGTVLTTTVASETFGGPADLWGTTWTAADVNAAGFGVLYSANFQLGPPNYTLPEVDYVTIRVYYS